ncbi:hypothetical protein DPMN_124261 [Dreissena polymorpha]|uniref:Uncharacterized protein n=1 Tax=Dreissena polymorpha TaxID=45954 RepID=A0A9D4GZ55_DREPO|nr:hypothetical protein DPMN_124261 [Dreissena polymorpha]
MAGNPPWTLKAQAISPVFQECWSYVLIQFFFSLLFLRQACIECCRGLIDIDPDLIWLKLCPLFCPKAYEPPSGSFKPIRVTLGSI